MADLHQLLEQTSRTFALCIPLLPAPTRHEVTLAYLLFRIADTFEDAAAWPKQRRVKALEDFTRLLNAPSVEEARRLADRWADPPPTTHEGYLELLEEMPAVFEAYLQLDDAARASLQRHVGRTAEQMAAFAARADAEGHLQLTDVADLRAYCYAVAGIVGEMLTDLFLSGRSALTSLRAYLHERAALFGEGLQLTNILKDAKDDAAEGRRFLPRGLGRDEAFALAHRGLDAAAEYTLALQQAGAPRGLVAFNALPLLLARATLDRVAQQGAGAKLTRDEVFALIASLNDALDEGRPVCEAPRRPAKAISLG